MTYAIEILEREITSCHAQLGACVFLKQEKKSEEYLLKLEHLRRAISMLTE